jgi:hypothetical protein
MQNGLSFFPPPGPGYEKYLTLEPDDMGDSPVENSIDDLESEITEDGERLCDLMFRKNKFQKIAPKISAFDENFF